MKRKMKLPENTFICIRKEDLPKAIKGELNVWDFLILGAQDPDSSYFPLCKLKEIEIPSEAELTRAGLTYAKVMEAKASTAFAEAKSMINNYKSALLLLDAPTVAEASDD